MIGARIALTLSRAELELVKQALRTQMIHTELALDKLDRCLVSKAIEEIKTLEELEYRAARSLFVIRRVEEGLT